MSARRKARFGKATSLFRLGELVNVGGATVSLKMTGPFSRGNERYDAQKNPIKVVMTPTKALQRAAATLEPVNVTEKTNPRIENVAHETVKEGRRVNALWVGYPVDVLELDLIE